MASISPERRAMLDREQRANASSGEFFSTKNLTTDVIRLIPLAATEQVGYKRVSYFINKKSFICNEETHQKPGIIAKTIRALERTGDDAAIDLAKTLRKNRKYKFLMKIIARSNPAKPVWFEAPASIYEPIFAFFKTDDEDISHVKEGRDVRITKTGSGLATEYATRPMDKSLLAPTREERDAIRAAAAQMRVDTLMAADENGALEALRAIITPKIWNLIAKDVGEAASSGGDEDADPNAPVDEETAPAPAKAAPKASKPAPAVVDEEETAPAPAPKKAAPAKAAVVMPDEEEAAPVASAKSRHVVADDEEDAPRPAAKRSTAAAASDDADLDDE